MNDSDNSSTAILCPHDRFNTSAFWWIMLIEKGWLARTPGKSESTHKISASLASGSCRTNRLSVERQRLFILGVMLCLCNCIWYYCAGSLLDQLMAWCLMAQALSDSKLSYPAWFPQVRDFGERPWKSKLYSRPLKGPGIWHFYPRTGKSPWKLIYFEHRKSVRCVLTVLP